MFLSAGVSPMGCQNPSIASVANWMMTNIGFRIPLSDEKVTPHALYARFNNNHICYIQLESGNGETRTMNIMTQNGTRYYAKTISEQ